MMIFPAINLHLQGDFPITVMGNEIPVKIETSERPKVERANFLSRTPGICFSGIFQDHNGHMKSYEPAAPMPNAWMSMFFFFENIPCCLDHQCSQCSQRLGSHWINLIGSPTTLW